MEWCSEGGSCGCVGVGVVRVRSGYFGYQSRMSGIAILINYLSVVAHVLCGLGRKIEIVCEFNEGKPKQCLYKELTIATDQPIHERLYQVIDKPSIRVYCSDCELDLTRHPHIITKHDYYCIPCFANLELFPQDYVVRQSLRLSPTATNWDLLDELVMVNAFSLWGFSNWAQIKDYMDYNGSPFALSEIQSHFLTYHYPTPSRLLSFARSSPRGQARPLHGENALLLYEQALSKVGELKRRESKGEKKISSMKAIPQFQGESERMIKPPSADEIKVRSEEEGRAGSESKHDSSVLGYNPKRGEFEYIYYDIDAEKMLDDLEFYEDDTPEEYQLKIQLIQNYNLRLDQRAKRKHFTLQYKLLDSQYQFAQKPEEQKAAVFFEPVMRYTANLEEYRSLIGEFTTLAKYQKFISILNKIRRSVTPKGQIRAAFDYLIAKRLKSIEMWERAYNKKYKDKKRRKVYQRKPVEETQILNTSQMQEQLPQQALNFDLFQANLVQFMQNGHCRNPLFKVVALVQPKDSRRQSQRQWIDQEGMCVEEAKVLDYPSRNSQ